MKKNTIAIVILMLIIIESIVLIINSKEDNNKNKVTNNPIYHEEENKISIVDILGKFQNNSSITLSSIKDIGPSYEISFSMNGIKEDYHNMINEFKEFTLSNYSINLSDNGIEGRFTVIYTK